VVPLKERSILKPLSLVELSVQERLIRLEEATAAFRLDGGLGVGFGDGVGVGTGVGVADGGGTGLGVG
jgi:hypothetical protein